VSLIDCFPHTPLVRDPRVVDGARSIDADFGTARQSFLIGPGTTATPGLFAGLGLLAATGGTRPLTELVEPAIDAARSGVEVTAFQAHLSSVVAPILTATESTRVLFAPGGVLLRAGETMTNPGLADALAVLARNGLAGSEVGAACLDQQAGRGHVTAADLAAYEPVVRHPIAVEVGGDRVHLNPFPAAGGILVAHTLAQLETADPVATARALAATGAARRAAAGDLAALAGSPVRPRGTTHVSVVDADGGACAITVSNGEGNGEVVDGYGFMLNNILGEDDVNPAGAHRWPVDTRLSSMMCPTIVEHADGSVTALGSGGSNRIRSAITQVVAALSLDGARLREAVDRARLHVEGDHLDIEDHVADDAGRALRAAFPDHRVWPRPDLFFGGVHAACRAADGSFTGAGDSRRDGVALTVA
jgi:gamma-glutamyltranspeptidase/glutathione hydrolase